MPTAEKALLVLGWLAGIVVVTGTFLYSYPATFESLETAMVWTHEISGDLTVLFFGLYLIRHLENVWRMWRFKASRWSGYLAVLAFLVSAVTGVWGQLSAMLEDSTLWWVHAVASIVAVVVGCGHGAYGFRRRLSQAR